MMAVLRLAVIAFVVLTVVYISLSFYSRAARREKLEREWDADVREGDRKAFVRAGLNDYDGSLRRKLIIGVYVVPVVAVAVIVYVVNYM